MFHTKYAKYCSNCGYVHIDCNCILCPFCRKKMKDSDWSFEELQSKAQWELNWIEDDIFQRFVKNNPDINQKAYNKRTNYIYAREQRAHEHMEEMNRQSLKNEAARERAAAEQANAPRCPTCGSTDLKKIDALDRAISVSFLGLASGKIGKSFKCNHCGYMW